MICNRPGAKVIERAKAAGIICAVMDHKLWPSREAYDLAVADAILKSGADTVALAGYMRMLTAGFLNAFPHRVVNVHPALLPSFPGIHGAADAQAWGVKITGCTVHLVDEIMDHGEVIIQAAVPAIAAEQLKREGLRICNFVQPPPDRVSILVTRAGEELSEYGKIFLQELGESIRGVKDVQIYL